MPDNAMLTVSPGPKVFFLAVPGQAQAPAPSPLKLQDAQTVEFNTSVTNGDILFTAGKPLAFAIQQPIA